MTTEKTQFQNAGNSIIEPKAQTESQESYMSSNLPTKLARNGPIRSNEILLNFIA